MDARSAVIAHAEACRAALYGGRERHRYEGPSLVGADLSGADLTYADLTRADLSGADLSGADLTGADLSGADLSGAVGIATEAEEAATWAAVREAVRADRASLRMAGWHGNGWSPDADPGGCGTTHCLAGWAQALSEDPEIRRLAPAVAGSRLLPRHARLFLASDADALAALGLADDNAATAAQE